MHKKSSQDTFNFNADWLFHLGDIPEAFKTDQDDSSWRQLNVPHDWSAEQSFTQEDAGGSTAFLPGGIGWYRKHFKMPDSASDQITRIEFDGIYNNAEVWINGHYLGMRPYGYVPFSYDLTAHLNYGNQDNVIAVKVDRSAYLDCRWYPGSGIYRNVRLVTVPKVHIPQWGTFITTPIATAERAEVSVKTTLSNKEAEDRDVIVKVSLTDSNGNEAGTIETQVNLPADQTQEFEQTIQIDQPQLWNTQSPNLYTARTEISSNGTTLEKSDSVFGIRHIRYDVDKGFFLNGIRTVFKGVCLHHEGGCVGAAVPIGVWERRLRLLQEMGCNAIRTAHNPPSEEFLDLCDRMGFLVQDEAFDEWDNPKDKRHNYNQQAEDEETKGYTRYFSEWSDRDIQAMVLRDRNHPSIVMWSIGNEIEWTYPGYEAATGYWEDDEEADYYLHEPPYDDAKRRRIFNETDHGEHILAETAARLATRVRELDTTRPVTANMVIPTVSQFSGYADALDIDGYSYRQSVYEYCRERNSKHMIFGSENWAQWSEWKPVLEHEYIAGIFLWTGVCYLGESRKWPVKANHSGVIDLAGFAKPNYHYFRSLWNDEKMVKVTTMPLAKSNYIVKDGVISENPENKRETYWGWPDLRENWNYTEGEEIYVEVYSNCESVELFLNEKSLGIHSISDNEDRIFRWVVPFEAGSLKAVAINEKINDDLRTASQPSAVRLEVDRNSIHADTSDVVHCVAQLVDAAGLPVSHTEMEVHFQVDGDATNIGIDNGACDSIQDYKSDKCVTENGRCLMILQAGKSPDTLKVSASSENLETTSLNISQI
ncbi:sugar-binding domain-containing protein [Rubellicoccus peritrichatus]|uniref:Glycoside hydrolase family 2 TIM barrel-domain containing protein n=1 Tax=Rubellicoccus peritrichatus TaxID=3080537 RepID=A0AAQ3L7C8_9BACT|nr:sugar-binding domain-containing protein [Puniceicoccus sp. CR14]WOO39307.1 glycoside hydrolase family 2 TIM barrel-domain containing protein [Puniceicoccus sp. CR14]